MVVIFDQKIYRNKKIGWDLKKYALGRGKLNAELSEPGNENLKPFSQPENYANGCWSKKPQPFSVPLSAMLAGISYGFNYSDCSTS
jgi:hypothetical protein